ncbi:hypothetical protein A9404_11260 [Halothiobacillus diazotrophicus]|uniref:DUF3800 domain-containing protein n=1 Tax=Halothiobacillus diazotrophicus TaxID=1860122 RepID=A0A191ZJ61_9GAMM|nr:DUF3800 domain-containing protein [Halothiobacillus diazotrophicus]ANJ67878.1 hypothetical protein A9404_11260 [Halothiobacillus diazotrophicus]
MNDVIHIYCDESCHLEHDHQKSMVLGAVWCSASHRAALGRKVKAIRDQFGLPPTFEIKWTKISPAGLDFYLALVDLFFDEPLLRFRAVVVPEKAVLDHGRFNQSHDDFYYKMWYLLLTHLVDDQHCFRVFLDIKDTRGQTKVRKLHEVLCNRHYDFDRQRIASIEQVHSHDVPLLQIADLMIGALSHLHRNLDGSPAKQAVIQRIRERSGHDLLRSTPPRVEKFNLLVWRSKAEL